MLVPVILSGFLAKRFGKRFEMDVKSPREAVRALCIQLKGFERAILDHQPGFRVWADKEPIDSDNLKRNTGARAIRIVPVVAGSKNADLEIIVGAILIYLSWGAGSWVAAGWGASASVVSGMGMVGTSMLLGGVSQLLFKPPTPPTTGQSYLFGGPVNTTAQGNCVPVCYGRMIVGSQEISAGFIPTQVTSPIPVTIPGSGSGWNPTLTDAVG